MLEFRKDFTVSERVEIGKALEAELGNRNGKRPPENFPEVRKGDTRDLAAKAAGFGNGKTYESCAVSTPVSASLSPTVPTPQTALPRLARANTCRSLNFAKDSE